MLGFIGLLGLLGFVEFLGFIGLLGLLGFVEFLGFIGFEVRDTLPFRYKESFQSDIINIYIFFLRIIGDENHHSFDSFKV